MKMPKGWVCEDMGLVLYMKKENGINYEMAASCRCRLGVKYGDGVPRVSKEMAELVAEGNFKRWKEKHPEAVKKIASGE